MSKRLPSTVLPETLQTEETLRKEKKEQDSRDSRVRARNRLKIEQVELQVDVENLKYEKKRLEDATLKLKVERAREERLKKKRSGESANVPKPPKAKRSTPKSTSNQKSKQAASKTSSSSASPSPPQAKPCTATSTSNNTPEPPVNRPSVPKTTPFPIPNYPPPPSPNLHVPPPPSPFNTTPLSSPTPPFTSSSFFDTIFFPPLNSSNLFFSSSLPLFSYSLSDDTSSRGAPSLSNASSYTPRPVHRNAQDSQSVPTYTPSAIGKVQKKSANPIKFKTQRPLEYWEALADSIKRQCAYGKRMFQNPRDELWFEVFNYDDGAVRVKIGGQWINIAYSLQTY